jgi:hypothetical protein
MIKIENAEVSGWHAALRGMRDPMASWEDGCDSFDCNPEKCPMVYYDEFSALDCHHGAFDICIGERDMAQMRERSSAEAGHPKYLRMITVSADITAPLYWWNEYDAYKVGTVDSSYSTLNRIGTKEFTIDDFSYEYLDIDSIGCLDDTIRQLNLYRDRFKDTQNPTAQWGLIQLLPACYNQKRTVMLNYAVLKNMYHGCRSLWLGEWLDFCNWAEKLPYFKVLCIDTKKKK